MKRATLCEKKVIVEKITGLTKGGIVVVKACEMAGVTPPTYYKWKRIINSDCSPVASTEASGGMFTPQEKKKIFTEFVKIFNHFFK
jgi:hypothetical protein